MRIRWNAAVVVTAVSCLVATSAAATAATRYRTCFRGHVQIIKARPSVKCARADRIARAGLHVDGDDGAHFRLFGRRWQCVTIKRPDHGRHTLLGCFTPSAPPHFGARTHPRVTLLLKKEAD